MLENCKELSAILNEEIKHSPSRGHLGGRHMLANHVSVCCQPEHRGGVVGSLEEPELWNIAASATGGKSEVTLTLPNLFTQLATPQAAISFTYKHPDVDQAKDFACLTTLLFALVVGPNLVRLHPNTVRNAACGSNLVPIWFPFGSNLVPVWFPNWNQMGTKLEPIWNQFGTTLELN